MRGRIVLTVVLLVGLLAASGAAAAAPQPAADGGTGAPADSGVGPDCIDTDGDGECDLCYVGEPPNGEYVPC